MAQIVKVSGDYHRAKVKIEGLNKNIKVKANRRINNVILQTAFATRKYINSRTHGFGQLAESIKIQQTKEAEVQTWSLYQDAQMTLNERGNNYAQNVNKGFTPHFVRFRKGSNLDKWLKKNLDSEKYKKIANRGVVYVGRTTEWNDEGLQFDRYAFNHIKNNMYKVNEAVGEAVKK